MSTPQAAPDGQATAARAPWCRVALRAAALLAWPACASAEDTGLGRAALQPLQAGRVAEVVLALLAVLALIVVAAWVARRLGHARIGANAHLRVLGALPIGPRERVVLMQVGNEQVLLGVSSAGIRSLQVLTRPVELPGAARGLDSGPADNGAVEQGSGGFGAVLERVVSGRRP